MRNRARMARRLDRPASAVAWRHRGAGRAKAGERPRGYAIEAQAARDPRGIPSGYAPGEDGVTPGEGQIAFDFCRGDGSGGRGGCHPRTFGTRLLSHDVRGDSPQAPRARDEVREVRNKKGLTRDGSALFAMCVPAVSCSPARPPSQYHRR
jgi:hypothetical protein